MKALVAASLAVLALGAGASGAAAQSFTEYVLLAPGVSVPMTEITLPVSATGGLSVDFHGSESAGCAAVGRCELSGTEVFNPGRAGTLLVEVVRVRGKRKLFGTLALDSAEPTVAQTERASASGGAGHCSDLAGDGFYVGSLAVSPVPSLSLSVGRSLSRPLGTDFFASRCAGPLAKDLTPFIPSRRLSRSIIEHGGKLDLSTTRPFSAAGFAGTLRSTIVLRFRHPRRIHFPGGIGVGHGRRLREFAVSYKVERVSGGVGLGFSGLGDPDQCLVLDACGVTGKIAESPDGTRGSFDLELLARAARPRRDLRTLLGLAKGGRTAGLAAIGLGSWAGRGVVKSLVSHNDGSPPCSDVQRLRTGVLQGSVRHSHLRLQYGPPEADSSLNTRCGGPLQSDLVAGQALASGEVSIGALRRRTFTVHLKRPPAVVPTTGYSGSMQADITITLRRTSVRERVLRGL